MINNILVKLGDNLNYRNILSNTSWLFFEKIFRMIVTLFIGIWVARYLGPENFGTLNYAQSTVTLFMTVAILGLDSIVVRELVGNNKNSDKIMGTAFVLMIVGSIVSILSIIILNFILNQAYSNAFMLSLIISVGVIFQPLNVIDYWFQAKVRSKYVVIVKSISFIIISILKVILLVIHANLLMFGLVISLELFLSAIGLVTIYCKQKANPFSWTYSWKYAKEMLLDSWPLLISSLAIILYMRIDQIMLGKMSTERELGLYSAAVKIAEMWYFIPTVIISTMFPYLVKEKNNHKRLLSILQKVFDFLTLISIVAGVFVTLFSKKIMILLYGQDYANGSIMLSIYIWIGVFVSLGMARSSYLKVINKNKILLIASLLGCISNVALNVVLIPKYGGLGATYASLFSYWLQAHGICFFVSRTRPIGIMMFKAMLIPFRWNYIIKFLKK
ncbi:flippase [Priestia megaterium]|uniref:flippase n=1 Tax=Priestia megaterium TaxID=1404 RepID=UPI0032D955DA